MKRYRVIGEIILSFLDGNIQRDFAIRTGSIIECDGKTVWYVNGGGQKHESITTANIVEFGIKNGSLEEVMALRDEIYVKEKTSCPDCGGRGFVTGFPENQKCSCMEKLTLDGVASMLHAYRECVKRTTVAQMAKNILPDIHCDEILNEEREVKERLIKMMEEIL